MRNINSSAEYTGKLIVRKYIFCYSKTKYYRNFDWKFCRLLFD